MLKVDFYDIEMKACLEGISMCWKLLLNVTILNSSMSLSQRLTLSSLLDLLIFFSFSGMSFYFPSVFSAVDDLSCLSSKFLPSVIFFSHPPACLRTFKLQGRRFCNSYHTKEAFAYTEDSFRGTKIHIWVLGMCMVESGSALGPCKHFPDICCRFSSVTGNSLALECSSFLSEILSHELSVPICKGTPCTCVACHEYYANCIYKVWMKT